MNNDEDPGDGSVREEFQIASCFSRELDVRKRGSDNPRDLFSKDTRVPKGALVEYFEAPTDEPGKSEPDYHGRVEQNQSPLEGTTPIPIEMFGKHIRYGSN